jgi:hypothetical protein
VDAVILGAGGRASIDGAAIDIAAIATLRDGDRHPWECFARTYSW